MLKSATLAALTLVTVSAWAPAHAAPLPAQQLDNGAPAAQNVDYRRCWYRGGARHCRYYRSYRRYGYGPGFRFYFGPGGHRWHGHHRRWW